MGYTQYRHRYDDVPTPAWSAAIADVRKLFAARSLSIAAEFDEPGRPPIADENRIAFNGIGEKGHETFWFDRAIPPDAMRLEGGQAFEFCKTGRKPYDLIVVAVLAVLAERLGDTLRVSSDGDPEDWQAGTRWASQVLGRTIPVPPAVINRKHWEGL